MCHVSVLPVVGQINRKAIFKHITRQLRRDMPHDFAFADKVFFQERLVVKAHTVLRAKDT